MVTTHEGKPDGAGLRIGVVNSRFSRVVTERLLTGAIDALRHHRVAEDAMEIAHVPGAFEIPLVADLMAASKRVDAVVCLGALIKGETPHFDLIAASVVNEIGRLIIVHRVPIALGVLTTNSTEQALSRSGGQHGNKGADAAVAAIQMANLCRAVA